jgi:hypothetical protein
VVAADALGGASSGASGVVVVARAAEEEEEGEEEVGRVSLSISISSHSYLPSVTSTRGETTGPASSGLKPHGVVKVISRKHVGVGHVTITLAYDDFKEYAHSVCYRKYLIRTQYVIRKNETQE